MHPDTRATVLSIDGIGAFDLISRKSMLEASMTVEGGPDIMPFVRQFYGQPSMYLWESDDGTVHHIEQGEGGEQGDPLMPLLFALGQHASLCAIDEGLAKGERLMAFLDDVYISTDPEGLQQAYGCAERELWRHARIRCMKGRHKSGIQVAKVLSSAMCWNGLPKLWIQKLVCGRDLGCLRQIKAFGCWGHHWGTQITWKLNCVNVSMTTNCY